MLVYDWLCVCCACAAPFTPPANGVKSPINNVSKLHGQDVRTRAQTREIGAYSLSLGSSFQNPEKKTNQKRSKTRWSEIFRQISVFGIRLLRGTRDF